MTIRPLRALAGRLGVLDWIRIGLLVAGVLFVVTGLLPAEDAERSMRRIAPLLLFLGSVIVLASLTRQAKVFDAIAARLAILGRGNYVALFLLCVTFAATTTIFLNLDTTAVLLTPVFLALAPKARIAPLPLAITTIWLANTASLLLPVSNLTNLLAADRVALHAPEFLARMWAPQLAAIVATVVFLWVFYWRRGTRDGSDDRDRYRPPEPVRLTGWRQRALFWVATASCLLFIVAVLVIREQIGYAAAAAAVIVTVAFAVLGGVGEDRDHPSGRPAGDDDGADFSKPHLGLIPWQLLIFVTGLFLVVPTLSRYGLADIMTTMIGTSADGLGAFRAAAAGAGLSNVINNLPAYVAGEAVVPVDNHDQLLALLIGTNVGPIVTPWASLATLLCLESCRRHGLRVPMGRFVLTGLGLAVVSLVGSVAALLVTR